MSLGPILYLVAKYQMSSGPHGPIFYLLNYISLQGIPRDSDWEKIIMGQTALFSSTFYVSYMLSFFKINS